MYPWLVDRLVSKGWETASVQSLADYVGGDPDLLGAYPDRGEGVVVVTVTKMRWAAAMPLTKEFLNDVPTETLLGMVHDRLVRAWSVAVFTG